MTATPRFRHTLLRGLLAIALVAGVVPAITAGPAAAATSYGVITTYAGTGERGDAGDGGPATEARISADHLDVAPADSPYAGQLFFTQGRVIRRVLADGTIERFAGGGSTFTEGGERLSVLLPALSGIDVAPDGTVYIAAAGWIGGLYEITPDGDVNTLIEPTATYNTIQGIAATADDTVYFAVEHNHIVYRYNPDGSVNRFYGNGMLGCRADGSGSSVTYRAQRPWDVALSPDEATVYIADRTNGAVWAVPADDPTWRTLLTGQAFPSCPAPTTGVHIPYPRSLDVDADGALYVAGNWITFPGSDRVYRVHEGDVDLLAGSDSSGYGGDGGPALDATLSTVEHLAVAPDGTVYFVDESRYPAPEFSRIRRIKDVPVPSDLIAGLGNGSVTLAWSAVDAANYEIWRAAPGAAATKIATLPGTDSLYEDTGLTNGVTYTYHLVSLDADGNASPPSPEVSATPTAPQIDVSLDGSGTGTVTSAPSGISCGSAPDTAATDCSEQFSADRAEIVAVPDEGSHFAGWSGCDTPPHESTCGVSTTSSRTMTATFNTGQQLRLERTGPGTVTGPGIDCGAGCDVQLASFEDGAAATLTATPDEGKEFKAWLGCTDPVGLTCNLTMDGPNLVVAMFEDLSASTLAVIVNGQGSVTSDPAGIDCRAGVECLGDFTGPVTLTATPDEGHTFMGWTGCDEETGDGTCTIDPTTWPDDDTLATVSARFAAPEYGLVVTKRGDGYGRVYTEGGALDCIAVETSCSTTYGNGQTVVLTAEPQAGSTFDGFAGLCQGYAPGDTTCTLAMTATRSVTATFTLPDGDGDGVKDPFDGCPATHGGPNGVQGCPDRDGDGFIDLTDGCPDQPGTVPTGGCPDRDGDEVWDGMDRCPDTPGNRTNEGCPNVSLGGGSGGGRGGSSGADTPDGTLNCIACLLASPGGTGGLAGQQSFHVEVATEADPVNVVFGNFTHQHVDLSVPGVGLPVNWLRSYNSAAAQDGPLGHGWSLNLAQRVADHGSRVQVTRADGRVEVFERGHGDGYVAPSGSRDRLARTDDGGWVLTSLTDAAYTFDGHGRLASVTDVHGNRLRLSYDGDGLAAITDASGRTWRVSVEDGRIQTVTDSAGRTVRYGYDARGDLTSVTDPAGGVTRYVYDDAHRITRILDANGNLFVGHVYDDAGRVVEQTDGRGVHRFTYRDGHTVYTDPDGASTTTHFDGEFRVTKKVDELGRVRTFAYDEHGRLVRERGPAGADRRVTYDEAGDVRTVTDATGTTRLSHDSDHRLVRIHAPRGVTVFSYDDRGRLVRITEPDGAARTIAYDDRGQPVVETDALGNTTRVAYDRHGNTTAVTDAGVATTRMRYDAAGRLVEQIDPLGRRTRFQYDPRDLLLTVQDAAGGTTTFGYDRVGNRIRAVDPAGHATTFTYDRANDLVMTTDATGRTTRDAYDGLGRPVARTLPDGTTWRTDRDLAGRVVAEVTPLGHATRHVYDAADNLVAITDANGSTHRFAYDRAGRITAATDPAGGRATYGYDRAGNVATVTDPRGHATRYTYDLAGRVTAVEDAEGRVRRSSWDRAGRLVRTEEPGGGAVHHSYDARGLLVGVRAAGIDIRYGYDAAGQRTSMADGRGTTRYAYDPLGRVTRISGPDGTLAYGYDRAGNRRSVQVAGATHAYRYDAAGRLTEVSLNGTPEARYTHDRAGRAEILRHGNGLLTRYRWDDDGRPVELRTSALPTGVRRLLPGGERPVHAVSYRLDATGNRVEERAWQAPADGPRGRSTTSAYRYDELGRLVAANVRDGSGTVTYRYAYDAAGNRVLREHNGARVKYRYDRTNRVRLANRRAITHDAAGRVTDDGRMRYDYDGLGRLARVEGPRHGVAYAYNGDGLRVAETINGATTRAIVDAVSPLPAPLARIGPSGTEHVVTAGGMPLSTQGRAATYLHADALGSVRWTSDAGGERIRTQRFDPFGVPLGPIAGPGFAGEVQSPMAGLLHLRARDYHPLLGRFLAPDPHPALAGVTQSLNAYHYAYNNPGNRTDRTGRLPESSGNKLQLVDEHGSVVAVGSLRYIAALSGIIATGGGNIIATGGGNIISTGGGNIISTGGGNLVAALAGIIATGGGNVTSQINAAIIAAGGGNIISTGGGNLVASQLAAIIATGGGNIIATGGGNLAAYISGIISTGGGNIIATGGGNIISTGGGNIISTGGGNIISTGGGN